MNDFKRDSISRSIGDVMKQIAGVDEGLAGLFGRIADIAMKTQREHGEEVSPNKVGREISDRISSGKMINTIPFGEPCGCLEECLVITFETINSNYGFNKIMPEVNKYWINCSKENCITLIITKAWDTTKFNRKYKENCDIYSSTDNKKGIKHTVAIVLLGDYGFSLQYLR